MIDRERCISCGLCVARCPVAAIHLAETAIVNDEPSDLFTVRREPTNLPTVHAVARKFSRAQRSGPLLGESDALLSSILRRVEQFTGSDAQLPNILSRNLLLASGISCVIRRRGDNNVRMDMLLGPPGVKFGTAEVELGYAGIMDAPRSLLDNVAVLCSRHGLMKREMVALVIASGLPNRRSEYWQLAKDIADVVGVRIGSVTWAALLVLVWQQVKLKITARNEFYADSDSCSIRAIVESLIKRPLNCAPGTGGFLESQK
jgi:ferredoxin